MNIITADTLPNNMRIKEIHGIIETTYPIEISKKGFIRGLVERNKNEHQEAYDNFVNLAKELGNGNTIYGNWILFKRYISLYNLLWNNCYHRNH